MTPCTTKAPCLGSDESRGLSCKKAAQNTATRKHVYKGIGVATMPSSSFIRHFGGPARRAELIHVPWQEHDSFTLTATSAITLQTRHPISADLTNSTDLDVLERE